MQKLSKNSRSDKGGGGNDRTIVPRPEYATARSQDTSRPFTKSYLSDLFSRCRRIPEYPHFERPTSATSSCRAQIASLRTELCLWLLLRPGTNYDSRSPPAFNRNLTSSSAVAEKPRDALCPLVVSLNKIIPQAESFIIVTQASYLPLRNAVFGVTLRLLVIHFVVLSRHQQTPTLTSDYCHQLAMVRRSYYKVYCTCRWNGKQHAMKPDIGSESRFLPVPPAFDSPIMGVPVGILQRCFVRKN